ncbi:helix-turn-helix domain-containing protein [Neobacillus dielmonensis]|uniref:helix-turn-helix domain-containing protein n=1 Tax=Neobacillus dielmonensis TaxID=1347369 RepID=UPI0005AA88BE|nr:helix-turn-helix domain-containing protein [Neobacillus dielmonensis]
MEQIETIILFCLKQLNGERTVFSIFHLLNGKKSSQTIQDAHLFDLKRFFGVFDQMTRESFEEIIHGMDSHKKIQGMGQQRYGLTTIGEEQLKTCRIPKYLNGWDHHQHTNQFWERLSLLIQVASNLAYQETNYIPIQKNQQVHDWIKVVLRELNIPKRKIGSAVLTELFSCFKDSPGVDPSILVYRLSGYRQIGLTAEQAAKKFCFDSYDYHTEFINILHFLMEEIDQNRVNFPILQTLFRNLQSSSLLTASSQRTWELWNQGYDLDQIALSRNLKVSTIEDHFVELALHLPDLSIDSYVSPSLQKEILDVSEEIETKQLKLIKNKVQTASYFQIRLVLARYGVK